MSSKLEDWIDEIYNLIDEGCALGEIEMMVTSTINAIRDERGL